MLIKLLVLLTFLVTSVSFATTFLPVAVDDQISEADGILIGHFLHQQSVRIEDGTIATQMTFKLSKEYGLASDLFGLEEILVHYPGGSLDGETVMIDGVPRFTVGEKVALLARNIDNRLWGLNLALGSFRIVNYGNETLLVNEIFPQDRRLSQIKLTEFENKVKTIKGSSLKVVKSLEVSPGQRTQGKNRSIASISTPEENESVESVMPNNFWLLAFFAVAGAVAGLRKKNRS